MPARQYGFTFLELVIVITILGGLAAVVLPKLGKDQHDARVAKTKSIYGAMRSAAALARSRCELDLARPAPSGTMHCRATPSVVDMDGEAIAMVNRYPAASASGIDRAAQLNLTTDGLTATDSSGGTPTRTYTIEGGNGPDCRITYQEARLNGSSIVAPVVVPYTTDC